MYHGNLPSVKYAPSTDRRSENQMMMIKVRHTDCQLFACVSVTGEKMLNTFCPGRGSNQDLLRGSQTLYRVDIKAGAYRKELQMCIIPYITKYSPSILDSQLDIPRIYFDTDVLRAIGWVILRWAPNVTGEKMLNTFCPGRGSNQDLLRGSQTLYRVVIKASSYRKAVQVCIIPYIST